MVMRDLRRPIGFATLLLLTVLSLQAMADDAAEDQFPPLGPLGPPPVPADNPMSAEKVELGKMLFFDSRLGGDNSLSCATCHAPEFGWQDGSEICRGYPGTSHWRNCQTVVNSAYYKKIFWAGSSTSLEAQAPSAARGGVAGNGERDVMEERLRQVPDYVRRFRDIFGTQWPELPDAWKAIAAFERSLVQRDTPFDKYMLGEKDALSEKAQKGLELFAGKAGCIRCHNGPFLTDEKYYNTGVPANPTFEDDALKQITFRFENYAKGTSEELYRKVKHDLGLYFRAKRKADMGKFRTPTLRYLEFTPPYMHNGFFFTLEEVIDFYDEGGGPDLYVEYAGQSTKTPLLEPLGLSKDEKAALLAFLESLSGEEILMDPPSLPDYAVLEVDPPRFASRIAARPAEKGSGEFPEIGPLPPLEAPDPELADLGRLLFFDPHLSGDGSFSCGHCHDPDKGWADGEPLSKAYPGTRYFRNAKTVLNAAHARYFYWDGRLTGKDMETQVRDSITETHFMNLDGRIMLERLKQFPFYVELFNKALGSEPSFGGTLKAIAAFERTLVSKNVPFDQGELSKKARQGLELFQGKAGCIRCHNGPYFSDGKAHNLGVAHNPEIIQDPLRHIALRSFSKFMGVPGFERIGEDPGYFTVSKEPADWTSIVTPTLRELVATAPYMHNGTLGTLLEVVEFYDRGGGSAANKSPLLKPLGLSSRERQALVAFLESLSGDPIVVERPEFVEYEAIANWMEVEN